jgi:hypothetical protein
MNPWKYKDLMEEAIEAEKKRQAEAQKTKPRRPSHKPGEMERENYLTGLWQQRLISEKDYNKEK